VLSALSQNGRGLPGYKGHTCAIALSQTPISRHTRCCPIKPLASMTSTDSASLVFIAQIGLAVSREQAIIKDSSSTIIVR
jgi:hypothetical protein